MASLANQLRLKAAACRVWAIAMDDGVTQSKLLTMAEQYDRIILQVEHLDQQTEGAEKAALSR